MIRAAFCLVFMYALHIPYHTGLLYNTENEEME